VSVHVLSIWVCVGFYDFGLLSLAALRAGIVPVNTIHPVGGKGGRMSGQWLGLSDLWNVADLRQEINQKLWQVWKKRKRKNNKRLGTRDAHQFVCRSENVLACPCVCWCVCEGWASASVCVLAWVMSGFCVCLVQCKQRTMHSVHNHWAPRPPPSDFPVPIPIPIPILFAIAAQHDWHTFHATISHYNECSQKVSQKPNTHSISVSRRNRKQATGKKHFENC